MFDVGALGSRLRFLRKSKKLTLQEVADGIGCLKSSLANIERGNKTASLPMVMSLAEFFDVSLDYLMGATDLPRPVPPHLQEIVSQANSLNELIDALNRVSPPGKEMPRVQEKDLFKEMLEGLDDESMEELRRYIGYLRVRKNIFLDKEGNPLKLNAAKKADKKLKNI